MNTLTKAQVNLATTFDRIDRERDQAMIEPRCQPEHVHLAYIRKLANAYSAYVAELAKPEASR
jgi:hypothetical protein